MDGPLEGKGPGRGHLKSGVADRRLCNRDGAGRGHMYSATRGSAARGKPLAGPNICRFFFFRTCLFIFLHPLGHTDVHSRHTHSRSLPHTTLAPPSPRKESCNRCYRPSGMHDRRCHSPGAALDVSIRFPRRTGVSNRPAALAAAIPMGRQTLTCTRRVSHRVFRFPRRPAGPEARAGNQWVTRAATL